MSSTALTHNENENVAVAFYLPIYQRNNISAPEF